MILGRYHAGMLGTLWISDFLLLLLLVPANPNGRGVFIAVLLWLVPTAVLGGATWQWWRHAQR